MEKLMKTFTKSLVQGVGLSLGLSIFVLGIFLVKGTDPLTVTNGETLTAEKWNALVEKVNTNVSNNQGWVEVDRNDTTTPFDIGCQRRWLRNDPGNTTSSTPRGVRYADYIILNGNNIYYWEGGTRYTISKTLKTRMTAGSSWRQISKLEKKCN